MAAETLRKAADLMRERARAVEPNAHIECTTAAAAENVRSWHPGVALAVADWLEVESGKWDAMVEDGRANNFATTYFAKALAVARAYLGEA